MKPLYLILALSISLASLSQDTISLTYTPNPSNFPSKEAKILLNIAQYYFKEHKTDSASFYAQKTLNIYTSHPYLDGKEKPLLILANIFSYKKLFINAISKYEEALSIFRIHQNDSMALQLLM